MTEALAGALRDTGCPSDSARQPAGQLRVERARGDTGWLLMLVNHGMGYVRDRDEVMSAAEHLARNVAADNTEAVDRSARGEPGRGRQADARTGELLPRGCGAVDMPPRSAKTRP
jgi:hypothetical protein